MEIINDCHVHLRGNEKAKDILKGMDKSNVESIILFSRGCNDTIEETRESINHLAKIAKVGKKRIYGFIRINPTIPGILNEIKRAILDLKLKGIKMLPKYWYPYEDRVKPVYKLANELKIPILFHSGILWAHGASSMYCRPTFYECLMDYPNVKFALAHISWPWTDECLAVAGRFWRGDIRREQMFVDITTGAPRIWKIDAMRKALSYLPHKSLIYGSDSAPWNEGYRDWVRIDFEILRELGATKETVKMIMHDNFYNLVE